LDSFTEVEAYALMASGYLMADGELRALQNELERSGSLGTWGDFLVDAPRGRWPFLRLADLMRQPPDSADSRRLDLAVQLSPASRLFFKFWRLVPALRLSAITGATALAVACIWLAFQTWDSPIQAPQWRVTVGHAIVFLLLLIAAAVYPVLKSLNPHRALSGYLTKTIVALLGWSASNTHMRLFDPLYLALG